MSQIPNGLARQNRNDDPYADTHPSTLVELRGMQASRHLELLCARFDENCARLASQPPENLNPDILHAADDYLWDLTQEIYRGIDSNPDIDLVEFKKEHFDPRVLKWYLTHPVLHPLCSNQSHYAGGYKIIEEICQDRRRWTKFEDVLLNHLLRSEMAQQHRMKVMEQAGFMYEKLTSASGDDAVLNIGCGPCFDLRRILPTLPPESSGHVLMVDVDVDALDFARKELAAVAPAGIQLSYMHRDALRAVRDLAAMGRKFDGIVFGGLFDYLPDRIASLVLGTAAGLLTEHGEILISQVSTANPNRTFMKWYGSWTLIEAQRDGRHPPGCQCRDPRGLNLLLARRDGGRDSRSNSPASAFVTVFPRRNGRAKTRISQA